MSVKSDEWIARMCRERKMIEPFSESLISERERSDDGYAKVISFGSSSYGYDVRLGTEFKGYYGGQIIDPKNIDDDRIWTDQANSDGSYIIEPHGFVLAHTIEYVRMPKNCIALVASKSSYARCGLSVNHTVLEPEWEGQITLELSNTTPNRLKVYANEGIAQLLFVEGDGDPLVSYAHRNGKYQYQRGVVPPRMKE